MRIRAPLLWLALLAMWLVLNGTLTPGQVTLGALAALAGVLGLAALQPGGSTRLRRPSATLAVTR
jgi:multisubunit Na+/H+ antiporter MnhE subunit